MATILTLVRRNELVELGGGIEDWEQPEREMYAFPHVIKWFEEEVENLKPELSVARQHDLPHGIQSPMEQLDHLIHEFVSGADFDVYEKAHFVEPRTAGVWELKTIDIRLFGWFYKKGVFIIANAASAFLCKKHQLYKGYRSDTERRRAALDLDEPKYISGGYSHVL